MALTEDIRRLLGYDQGPDNNSEITFKIKPLGSTAATPGISSDPSVVGAGGETGAAAGVGGASPLAGGAPGSQQQAQLPLGFGQGGQSVVAQGQRMKRQNPSLVTHPLGGQTDDIYEAAVAQLAFDTQSRYANLLQELGFVDDQGNFLPGTLETEAVRQRSELERQRGLGQQDVVEGAVRGGTVFSGRRAQLAAQSAQPFDAAIAELGTRLARELAGRYQGLGDLTRQFELGRNQLVAEAAERIKAGLLAQQAGGDGGAPPAGPPGAPPEAPPSGMQSSTQVSAETLNTMPPGSRVVYNPQVGYYVVNAKGQRIGHIENGMFINESIPVGGSRGSLAQ